MLHVAPDVFVERIGVDFGKKGFRMVPLQRIRTVRALHPVHLALSAAPQKGHNGIRRSVRSGDHLPLTERRLVLIGNGRHGVTPSLLIDEHSMIRRPV